MPGQKSGRGRGIARTPRVMRGEGRDCPEDETESAKALGQLTEPCLETYGVSARCRACAVPEK